MAIRLLFLYLASLQCVLALDADNWFQNGQNELRLTLQLHHNTGVAKNVILFIGDGMGVSTVTASRIYKGQLSGETGEETKLNFEKFPHVALSKTYNTDKQVPDSAGTSTAFLCGVKANFGTLGVDKRVERQNCTYFPEGKVASIVDWSLAAGKSVGLVTTTRVTHATPAAAFAHTPERDWESDTTMQGAPEDCLLKVKDIAAQLVEDAPNNDIKVILGGGRKHFLPYGSHIIGTFDFNLDGRLDGKDLTQIWLQDKMKRGANASFIWTKQQLDLLDTQNTDFVLGLFNQDHMQFDLNRNDTGSMAEPSLSQMVAKAIEILRRDPEGFFLLVEGGRIDHAHHYNLAKMALAETVAFDNAVSVAKEMTGDDTLIVVSADHSHVLSIAGYPDRGHDILGIQDSQMEDGALDGMPYTTLSYANGPGPGRVNLTGFDTNHTFFQQSRLIPMRYETHAGEDVAIYATGPMAHLFHGVHEQNYIAHVMAYASCVGPNLEHCQGMNLGPNGGHLSVPDSLQTFDPENVQNSTRALDSDTTQMLESNNTHSFDPNNSQTVENNSTKLALKLSDDQGLSSEKPSEKRVTCHAGSATSRSANVSMLLSFLVLYIYSILYA